MVEDQWSAHINKRRRIAGSLVAFERVSSLGRDGALLKEITLWGFTEVAHECPQYNYAADAHDPSLPS